MPCQASMVGAMSSFLNRKEPATRTSAPASTQVRAVTSLIPPSTDTCRPGLWSSAHSLALATLGTQSSMNDCPPNPGCTVITSTMSAIGRKGSSDSNGVSGLIEIPTPMPWSAMRLTASMTSPSASTWTVTESHPASANASTYLAGSWIIRWASNGRSVHGLTALMTGGPNVMLGTNAPSMTSRWTQSAPELSTRATSSPSLEKSAERIDGDTRVMRGPSSRRIKWVCRTPASRG